MNGGIRHRILLVIAPVLLRLISSTWRIEEEIPEECRSIIEGEEQGVIAFWHGRMLPVWYRFRDRGFAAVVSRSQDGELLARYLDDLGYRVIRGSSSRGGGDVLVEMVSELSHRSCLLTPDGPRGPARQAKAGGLVAAQRTGCRLLLVGWKSERSWRIRSWDRMEVPKPFAKIVLRYCIFESTLIHHPSTQQHEEIELHRFTEHELAQFSSALDSIDT